MQQGLRLSSDEVTAGADTLEDNRLTPNQIDDLVSVFRDFLSGLASRFPNMRTDLEALQDAPGSAKCAKLAACLLRWQDNELGSNGGFAATNANRTGLNYSIEMDDYKIFRYAFGLLYDLPAELENRFQPRTSSFTTSQGLAEKIV